MTWLTQSLLTLFHDQPNHFELVTVSKALKSLQNPTSITKVGANKGWATFLSRSSRVTGLQLKLGL